jgi:hypothetical protein
VKGDPQMEVKEVIEILKEIIIPYGEFKGEAKNDAITLAIQILSHIDTPTEVSVEELAGFIAFGTIAPHTLAQAIKDKYNITKK